MKVSNPHPTHDGVSLEELLDRQARALLKNSCVTLAGKEFDYLEDLHPADVAYILDSHCTCHDHFAGGEYVEITCERCILRRRMNQYQDGIPFDMESER